MTTLSNAIIVRKDGKPIKNSQVMQATMDALKELDCFTGFYLDNTPELDAKISLRCVDDCLIGRINLYIPSPYGEILFPAVKGLENTKLEERVLTLYFSEYQHESEGNSLPAEVHQAETFFNLSLSLQDIGQEFLQKLSATLSNILYDHWVYFCPNEMDDQYDLCG